MSLRPRLLPLLAASFCLILSACGGKPADPASDAAAKAMAVTAAPVSIRRLPRGTTVSGAVAAVEEMQLGVELSGQRVTALLVDVGQRVARGQLLLTLDHRTLDSDLAQAEAALREAEAGAALARANLARGQALAKDRFISAGQLDELRAARTQAEARAGTARAARDGAALRRSFADLHAPAAGIVSKRLVQPGQVVGSGSELLRLIRDGKLEWRAELPVATLASISPGDRVVLTAPSGATVEGRVRAVSPGVDAATLTGTVYADLPDPQGLAPGAYVEGRIDTGEAEGATVPAAAVVLRDGFPTVFVLDDKGLAHAQRVRTGLKVDGAVELLDGPKPGIRVAVDGAGFLADGDHVRIIAASTATATPASAVQ